MDKYYRVKKDTFLWKEGAILKYSDGVSNGGYEPIQDIWDVANNEGEYISSQIVEDPVNAEYFERVYPDTIKGNVFKTADKLRAQYKKAFVE